MSNLEKIKDALQWANDCLGEDMQYGPEPGGDLWNFWQGQLDAITNLNPVLQGYADQIVENMAMQKEIESLRSEIANKKLEIRSLRDQNDSLIHKLCTM